jgi:hypothetical protein
VNTPDEYCPFCSAPVVTRERRPNGNAVCAGGHTFALAKAQPAPPVKTPAELNAEWERIAADLGDGIEDTVERAVADAVRKEREAIAAWLEWFGSETAFPASFHALAVAVKQGDYPDTMPRGENP